MSAAKVTDVTIEHMVAALLRAGVILSGTVVAAGGIYYLIQHGGEAANYHVFEKQPSEVRIVHDILGAALAAHPTAIIQAGVLLLIATPIARVALSLAGFALERDRQYVLITAVVLAVLLLSLITGAAGG